MLKKAPEGLGKLLSLTDEIEVPSKSVDMILSWFDRELYVQRSSGQDSINEALPTVVSSEEHAACLPRITCTQMATRAR